MFIQSNQQHTFFNATRINYNLAKQNPARQQKAQEQQENLRRDSAIFSQNKPMSLVENLMQQKQRILERKNELISSTLERGNELSSIEGQLDSYDEQLKNMDTQISQAIADQMKDKTDEDKAAQQQEPKTKEEVQQAQLISLTNISTSLEQAKLISSVQRTLDGEKNVLAAEIKLDKDAAPQSKFDRMAEIEQQSAQLSNQIADRLINVADKVEQQQKDAIKVEKKEAEDIRAKFLTEEQEHQENQSTLSVLA